MHAYKACLGALHRSFGLIKYDLANRARIELLFAVVLRILIAF